MKTRHRFTSSPTASSRVIILTATLFLTCMLLAPSARAVDAISLHDVWPSAPDGYLQGDGEAAFYLRIQIDTLHPGGLWVYNNAFRIYSPDGAYWDSTNARYLPGWLPFGDQSITAVDVDGVSPDTVLFFGEDSAGGFWQVYDDDTWLIRVYIPDSAELYGKTICLDTVDAAIAQWPYSTWFWTTLYNEAYAPTWDGPHCFTIGCCNGDGMRGNVDYVSGPGGEVDVADLTALVEYLWSGYWLPCFDEANVDGQVNAGSYEVTVEDIVYLAAYLFAGGPPPAPCP